MKPKTLKYRILIVDDEESLREVLSIMLHREGYQVDSAADGAQAVTRMREVTYDLVISDIKMPRLSGFELLRHIKERYAGDGGDHDYRLFLHRRGGRGDEAGGLRLHHQAVQERRNQADRQECPGAAGAAPGERRRSSRNSASVTPSAV